MDWLKKEYQAIKTSRTIMLAYAKKLAGLVTVLLAVSGHFEGVIDPLYLGVIVTLLGMADNKLRKITTSSLDGK